MAMNGYRIPRPGKLLDIRITEPRGSLFGRELSPKESAKIPHGHRVEKYRRLSLHAGVIEVNEIRMEILQGDSQDSFDVLPISGMHENRPAYGKSGWSK